MSNVKSIVEQLHASIEGIIATGVIDDSGMVVASLGSGIDMEVAGAGNSQVVRAKLNTMKNLGLNDDIEDILITLGKQYHIIRPIVRYEGMFIYVVLDRKRGNLALARRQVLEFEPKITL
jgi:predicted regulator of Ras-like GTPase activity (Roadblock/LC7/MglB family)